MVKKVPAEGYILEAPGFGEDEEVGKDSAGRNKSQKVVSGSEAAGSALNSPAARILMNEV